MKIVMAEGIFCTDFINVVGKRSSEKHFEMVLRNPDRPYYT